MKKLTAFLLCAALFFCSAFAESAQTASYRSVTVGTDAEHVDMGEQQIGDWDGFYAFLDALPNLKSVDLFATPVYAPRIEELTGRYPDVHFGMTMRFAEHTVRTDQTAFSTLHNNQSAQHTEKDFEILRHCDNLLALDVGHNHVTDLSFLHYFPHLKVLIIGRNAITDISPLSELKDLEYLEMFTNKVTDLSPLAGLEKLMDLCIAYNAVKDFSPLYRMTWLKRLWLHNANNYNDSDPVPWEVLRTLKTELKDCEIDSESHPTGGTWREHPRYFVIRDMFASGEYIPFETGEKP